MGKSTVRDLPISSRVIDIDARDFSSIEKALIELLTNSDESYYRLDKSGIPNSEKITVEIIRKKRGMGTVITCIDEAEGMDYKRLENISIFGEAFGELATNGETGRSFFGRGLKQSIYGLGRGKIESIKNGYYSRISYFKDNGRPQMDTHGGKPKLATEKDYKKVGIPIGNNGTKVTITVEKEVTVPYLETLRSFISNHYTMRDIVNRRKIYIRQLKDNGQGLQKEIGPLAYFEPENEVLIGPKFPITFGWKGKQYEALLTLKRALNTDLTSVGEERVNGLLIKADIAVLDCQFFKFDKTTGTERLFGELRCDALHRLLKDGESIINAARNGLNKESTFIQNLALTVEKAIEPVILSEREKRERVEKAQTSENTRKKIDELLRGFNKIAEELSIIENTNDKENENNRKRALNDEEKKDKIYLNFSMPRYIRKVNQRFKVTLIVDTQYIVAETSVNFKLEVPSSISLLSNDTSFIVEGTRNKEEFSIDLIGHRVGDKGTVIAQVEVDNEVHEVECEVIIKAEADERSSSKDNHKKTFNSQSNVSNQIFKGWEFKSLDNPVERTRFDEESGIIIINTDAPTVKIYINSEGQFKEDKAGMVLLAELLMDSVTEKLAKAYVARTAFRDDIEGILAHKQDFIRRYGTVFHKDLLDI
ncbi:hypothetical protein V7054_27120 [Priestia megaterium]|uniref:hypothetical protein n=1 Tax=Priestia megaterium TaxID=1404 RepID=UPI0030008F9E